MRTVMHMSLALMSAVAVQVHADPAPPEVLRCELLRGTQLAEIVDPTPRFAWVVPVTEAGGGQTAYQVQVVDAGAGFDDAEAIAWDSGRVDSNASVGVAYAGRPLRAAETYAWRVRVGVGGGALGPWSTAQRFTMAEEMKDAASRHPTVTTRVTPQAVTELEPGRWLLDFGRVAFGSLSLELEASTGGPMVVHFGERGGSEGVLRELPKRSSVRYSRVPLDVRAGAGSYEVHPPANKRNTKPRAIAIPERFGTVAPFRWVEIETGGVEITGLQAEQVALHTPWDPTASFFESSSEKLNDLWELCKYSMKATSFAGLYVDGDRERIPYEADALLNMLSHHAVDSAYAIGRSTHEYLMDFETWPTEWKQHSVMLAATDWMHTGDASSAERVYERLKAEKTLEERARPDGLLVGYPYPNHGERPGRSADIVDWPPGERDGFVFKDVNTVVNAFHHRNLLEMAGMAEAIGKRTDAEDYRQRAGRLAETFNRVLFDEQRGLYVDGEGTDHVSLHGNLFPLAFGLVPAERVEKVADYVESRGLACSVYAAQYLLEALYRSGRADAALRLMTMEGVRSWQNMLAVGSTITLEAWDDRFKPNQDWNHAWGAAPANAITRFLLGVRPLTPGYEKMLIEPQPGSLAWARGRVPTIRGPVEVSIEQEPGVSMKLELRVPGNTEPVLRLPVPEGRSVRSLAVDGAPGRHELRDGFAVVDGIASGTQTVEIVFE